MIYLLGIAVFVLGIILYSRGASALDSAFKDANENGLTLFNDEHKSAMAAFMDIRLISKLWSKDNSIFTTNAEINRSLITAIQRVRIGGWMAAIGGLIFIGAAFFHVS